MLTQCKTKQSFIEKDVPETVEFYKYDNNDGSVLG
jgi:hypothetical protein